MLSLRSSGKILGNPTSLGQLAQEHQLSSPTSLRELLEALGIHGSPEIMFNYGTHNLPEWDPLTGANFKDGVPDLGTFKDTFGTAEILHELLDPIFGHPILTGAFYAFYHYFLKGEANGGLATGFCTSLSSMVADNFWTGRTDTPTITKASVHKSLTATHGKLLSRESLIHFHDQSRAGAARVEQSCREVETTFLRGCGRKNAPLIFFIPSGAVWDGDYFDKLGDSHCVMPYRMKYPPGHPGPQLSPDGTTTVTDLNGVEMYVWDCNHPTDDKCKLVFTNNGGEIGFEYPKNPKLGSHNDITLGVMTNGDYLLSDHDLPFSGPAGLGRFIIDFLLSPADLQITDSNGFRTGNFGGQIHADIPGSHPCYLVPGAYLLPTDKQLTRRITGTGAGKYTFNSIIPDGGSIVLQDVTTAAGQVDMLSMSADQTHFRFTPAVEKTFNMAMARLSGDQTRAIALRGVGGGPAAEIDITTSEELTFVHLGNRGVARNVEVQAFVIDGQSNQTINKQLATVNVPSQSRLTVEVQDWKTVAASVLTLNTSQ
jgi:hypothetical protein